MRVRLAILTRGQTVSSARKAVGHGSRVALRIITDSHIRTYVTAKIFYLGYKQERDAAQGG